MLLCNKQPKLRQIKGTVQPKIQTTYAAQFIHLALISLDGEHVLETLAVEISAFS